MRIESADAVLVNERREAGREHRRRRRRLIVELCDDDHRVLGLVDVRLVPLAAVEVSNPRQFGRLAVFLYRVEERRHFCCDRRGGVDELCASGLEKRIFYDYVRVRVEQTRRLLKVQVIKR